MRQQKKKKESNKGVISVARVGQRIPDGERWRKKKIAAESDRDRRREKKKKKDDDDEDDGTRD